MHCIIMAGGSGTRFWPKSREHKPKQFLTIFGKKSLVQSTGARFQSMMPNDHIFVIAKENQRDEIHTQLSAFQPDNFIFEPIGKDTAPCIGLASHFVQQKDPDAIVVVTPADHLIRKVSQFRKTINAAVQLAEKEDRFVTIGIPPDQPATGYGYIQVNGTLGKISGVHAYNVKTFAEKPNLATAQRFVESGDFYWNSGMFIFKVSVLFKAIETFLPDLFEGLMEIKKSLKKRDCHKVIEHVYHQIKAISIDYGIMEKTKNVCLVKGGFVWSDLGNWEQVYRLNPKDREGNVVQGDVVLQDVKNSYVNASKGLITVVGLENIVVVQEGNATLVCSRDHVEDVKKVLAHLKRKKRTKYL